MKKIFTLILLFVSCWASAQLSSAKINRIQSASTAFGFNIPKGDILFDATTQKWYGVALARTSGETIGGLTLGSMIKEFISLNMTVQALSGTSVSWNCTSGINATLTLSGTTTVTLSNVTNGTSGNIKITNPSGAANILNFAMSGRTVIISPSVYVSSGRVLTSGSSKTDMYSWYCDGTNLIINGSNDYR